MTEPMTEHRREASPRRKARMAGAFYLLTFLTGTPALFLNGRLAIALGLVAGACYVAVTILLYALFKPVYQGLSFFAAVVSLVGCSSGPVSALFHFALPINPLVFFGFYCLLIGCLIFGSTLSPALSGCADGVCRVGLADLLAAAARKPPVTLHFLPQAFSGKERSRCGSSVMGVNSERWQEPASAAGFGRVRGSRTDESFTRFVFSYLRGDFGTVLWRRRFVFP